MKASGRGFVTWHNAFAAAVFLILVVASFCHGGSFMDVSPVDSVKEFDDVRWKDMSALDLSGDPELPSTLCFNQAAVWPAGEKLPAGCDPKAILESAKNPGLGVRALHAAGITGEGVNVAIIDQPLYQDHPEFAGKIAAYHDVGCGGSESSMHGPAVASLLVGETCGTAPGAKLYYVAAPSWTADAAFQAKALDWVVAQNEKLPEGRKIRLVSVSAAPSGPGSLFKKGNRMWDQAVERAVKAGILILDCTSNRGFIGPCFIDAEDQENVGACTPGWPDHPSAGRPVRQGYIAVPTCPRTVAEEYVKGTCEYTYWGKGGLSWAIPYASGVLAMGWQVAPELSAEEMKAALFKSAHVTENGVKVINPSAFIELLKRNPAR